MFFQSSKFACEHQSFAVLEIEQRFLSQSVASEQQQLFAGIINGKREHSVEQRKELFAHLLVEMHKYFSIAVAAENVTFGFKFSAQFPVVVYLAVEDDGNGSAFVEHRLFSAVYIDNGEPPVSQSNVIVDKVAAIIRTAVAECFGHAGDRVADIAVMDVVYYSGNCTHRRVPDNNYTAR